MRWPVGIALCFVVLFVVDFAFAYVAFHSAEPTVTSYREEKR
jgi:hypothetical protein